MPLKVVVVVGNPKPATRTRRVAELLVAALLRPGTCDVDVVDLADHVREVFTWPSEEMAAVSARVASSDLAVFAPPTCKATCTGLLKAFLDRSPTNELAGVTAVPVHTGADPGHSMGPTSTLSPPLAELGAAVPGRGLSFSLDQVDRVEQVVSAAAAGYAANLAGLARVAAATGA